MTDTSATVRADPPLSSSPNALPLPSAPEPALGPAVGLGAGPATDAGSTTGSSVTSAGGTEMVLHQLSRIEDKTARIEEKYARSEALLLRMGDRVDAAAGIITTEAARQSDLVALRNEVAALSRTTRTLPGAATLFVMALLTAVLTAAAVLAAMKYGIPGWLTPIGPPPR